MVDLSSCTLLVLAVYQLSRGFRFVVLILCNLNALESDFYCQFVVWCLPFYFHVFWLLLFLLIPRIFEFM